MFFVVLCVRPHCQTLGHSQYTATLALFPEEKARFPKSHKNTSDSRVFLQSPPPPPPNNNNNNKKRRGVRAIVGPDGVGRAALAGLKQKYLKSHTFTKVSEETLLCVPNST